MRQRFQSFINMLGFRWRNLLKWQRGPYHEPVESKEDLFSGRDDADDLAKNEAQLLQNYHLADLKARSSRSRYLETLTCLDALERLLPADTPAFQAKPLCWLDVGCKNWSTVEALYRYGQRHTPGQLILDGIELDAYRMYTNFHSRADYAHTFIRHLPDTTYRIGNVMSVSEPYDVMTWFLPFVFPEPCLAWGLPLSDFTPQALLNHVISLLNPGGTLVIVNQGRDEAEEQRRLLDAAKNHHPGLVILPVVALPPSFLPLKHSRFGWVCHKPVVLPNTGNYTGARGLAAVVVE